VRGGAKINRVLSKDAKNGNREGGNVSSPTKREERKSMKKGKKVSRSGVKTSISV